MTQNILHITSTANQQVKDLKALDQKKHREESGLFLVEGAAHLRAALASGWQADVIAATPGALAAEDGIIDAAQGARIFTTTPDILQRITGRDNAQGMIAALRQRTAALAETGPLALALEGIRDPGNLGTIIRTAVAAGVKDIILIGQTCDPFSPETIRATTGAFATARLFRCTQDQFRAWRPSWQGRLVGTHLRTQTDYRKADYAQPVMLVMGSEQEGLSPAMTDMCDVLVRIPMPGGTESLNLGVATGLMLYEMRRNDL